MAKTDRNERLAKQLRANLKKRKQQMRARKTLGEDEKNEKRLTSGKSLDDALRADDHHLSQDEE